MSEERREGGMKAAIDMVFFWRVSLALFWCCCGDRGKEGFKSYM